MSNINSTSATETKQMPEATTTIENSPVAAKEVAIKLLRHLNPADMEKNLNLLVEVLSDSVEADNLRKSIDVPSRVIVAESCNNREFLASARTESSVEPGCFRCPWDDKFYREDGVEVDSLYQDRSALPGKCLEVALNEAVGAYVSLYYGTDAISSVFVEDAENNDDGSQFSVVVLIKKTAEVCDEDSLTSSIAIWDSAHCFAVKEMSEESVYAHTATIMLSFDNETEVLKNIKLSGNMVYKNESSIPGTSKHLVHIGGMLEDCESRLRNDLQSVYFGRTHDIVNDLRCAMPEGFLRNQNDFRDEMLAKLSSRGQ